MTTTSFHTANLTIKDAQHLKAIDEFFSVPKSRRSRTTYKDTLNHFTTSKLEIWITIHQLSLWQDKDFVGKTALCRGHIVEKHYIKLSDDTILTHYQDYSAHPKFANLDQRGFPEASRVCLEEITNHDGVHLFNKESGSMNIAVFPARNYYIYRDPEGKICDDEIYRNDNYHSTKHPGWYLTSMYHPNGDHVTATYHYTHPLTHYITSKNGWKNEYAEAGELALKRCLGNRGQSIESLCEYLHKHQRSTIVYELMKFQEHVYTDCGEEIYVHMIDNCKTVGMSAFMKDFLPVVGYVGNYNTVTAALQRWEKDNDECNHKLEGYVLVVVRGNDELKIKLKFWKYLVLREFREALDRRIQVCPTCEELAEKYAMWGMPRSKWSWYITRTRKWFWRSRSPEREVSANKYIAIRDEFLAEDYELNDLIRVVAQNKPVMLYIVLTGVQCVGKSRFREILYNSCPGFARSQDECGGSRINLIKEIDKWATSRKSPGLYMTIIDRCNLNWEQRRLLYNDLKKVPRTGFVYTINISCDDNSKSLEKLFTRFIARENHQSFTKESVGAIKGLEIIRDSLSSYSQAPDGITIDWCTLPRVDLCNLCTPVEYNEYSEYPIKKRNPKFVYGGIAIPATSFPPTNWNSQNGGWYGNHITLVYGKDNEPLPDGVPVAITVLGKYTSDNISGLLVGVPNYVSLQHITLTTRNGSTPYQSNQVIEKIFGRVPDYDDVGRELEGIEWVVPYELQGWYGNYYN